jgi:uncharacterized phage protein (TIGR01671 family)
MREVKFRAWMPKERKWYKGGAVQLTAMQGNTFGLSEANGKVIELSQYTGLHDENGTDIYEGDIIIHTGSPYRTNYVVELHSPAFTKRLATRGSAHYLNPDMPYKVIGNIYENPELVKEAA